MRTLLLIGSLALLLCANAGCSDDNPTAPHDTTGHLWLGGAFVEAGTGDIVELGFHIEYDAVINILDNGAYVDIETSPVRVTPLQEFEIAENAAVLMSGTNMHLRFIRRPTGLIQVDGYISGPTNPDPLGLSAWVQFRAFVPGAMMGVCNACVADIYGAACLASVRVADGLERHEFNSVDADMSLRETGRLAGASGE